MGIIELIIVLVASVAVSNIISHYLPAIPISLFQILIGLTLALVANIYVEVDSHWFMLLFVAPLLFNDAWRFPKRELWELRGPILGNAILLVLITTLVGGYLIYLIIPGLPLSVALALAAVLSPTDPVAVQAIAKRVKLPANVMHVVSGESLINDATGLVSFNTAIKATVVGSFFLLEAELSFVWVTLAGLIVGAAMGAILIWIRDSFGRVGLNDIVFHTVVTLLMPFAIYWVAESIFHASGVIAVVTGGIVGKILNDRHAEVQLPEGTVMAVHTWEVTVYVLNGVIFVLLGIILPSAIHNIFKSSRISNLDAIYYGVAAWLIIFILRVLWAYGIQWGHRFRHRSQQVSFRTAIISGLTGVRGAVTMAAVLTIPTLTATGEAFPDRDLVIFIAAVVVILSLLAASAMLPLITKQRTKRDFTQPEMNVEVDNDDSSHPADLNELQARITILRVGIQVLRDSQRENNRGLVYELVTDRQKTIRQLRHQLNDDNNNYDLISDQEQQLREVAVEAQRDCLQQLLVHEKISPLTYSVRVRQLDRIEASLAQGQVAKFRGMSKLWRRIKLSVRVWLSDEASDKFYNQNQLAIREMAKAAIKALSEVVSRQEGDTVTQRMMRQSAYNLIVIYRHQIEQTKHSDTAEQRSLDERLRLELELRALNAERDMTQQLYEQGRITRQTSINLRQFINYAETNVLVGKNEE
ncbi:Na+/H+ antiporter [Leuconostocaceae bacterium ESL0723]|nr:Na+/H+ antiporter [Leuconostocaceae bacterium ESL0723]